VQALHICLPNRQKRATPTVQRRVAAKARSTQPVLHPNPGP
jgi:hypothetical protein